MSTADINLADSKDKTNQATTPGLITKLANDVSELVSTEMKLARAEVHQSVGDAKKGAASLVAAAVVLLVGTLLVLAAIPLAITAFTGIALWLSTLIVGAIAAVTGWILLANAKKKLSADELLPARTAESIQKDKLMVERNMS